MFLVPKIGSRFFTFISRSKPTLHSLVCSLPLCRSPLERGFLIIHSQTDCFFVWSSALSLLPEWNSSLWTSHSLLPVILPPFSALVLLLFLVCNFLLCPLKTHLFCLFGTCLFGVLSGKSSFINSSLLCPIYMNMSMYNVLFVHLAVFALSLYCPSHC